MAEDPTGKYLLNIAAGIILNDPHQHGRVAVALVAGVHAGNRGLSAAAGINAALAQVVVAHIEMPRAAAYGRLDAAAEAQVALYSGNQGRRVANVRVGKGRSCGGRI
ncbi:hypothetical protein DAPPUDRAFT_325604 [Daphnia pulex]|uniref:Uncharacterized protein n=1 Tax=Daphnia pulex TaxID=6669 RepID=E9H587_DAPPU|nr:hypothetical protein DAPPUDRAFT_325604 [Daphnia pulex]|eukprot:EFX73085.1 hypothetical protein DAPPUDRAFT_325604 [Daphnia pulex]